MVGRYRHTREVPLRTAKQADAISQDLMRRGFLGIGRQHGGLRLHADRWHGQRPPRHVLPLRGVLRLRHQISRHLRRRSGSGYGENCKPAAVSEQEVSMLCGLVQCVALEPSRAATVIGIS
ncbi:unnamed protein product [Urochloa humidicola]